MASIPNLLNPFYIYAKRGRIVPNIRYYTGLPVWSFQRFWARKGLPISSNDRKLIKLRDTYRGRRCFIIGNGPSLKIDDLYRLKSEITFASNKIYLAFDQTAWRPTYYAVEDELVAKQNYAIISGLSGFTKFLPVKMKHWIPDIKNATYFNFEWEFFYPGIPQFGIDALDKLYWGSTITYTCMQLACYMGIREIYLIGVDFDFTTPPETDAQNSRIYISNGEVNHFHPDYRKAGEKWYEPNLHHQEKSYIAAREAIQRLGGNIFNATRGGKLEIFPRVDFETLF